MGCFGRVLAVLWGLRSFSWERLVIEYECFGLGRGVWSFGSDWWGAWCGFYVGGGGGGRDSCHVMYMCSRSMLLPGFVTYSFPASRTVWYLGVLVLQVPCPAHPSIYDCFFSRLILSHMFIQEYCSFVMLCEPFIISTLIFRLLA